ncbi:uncharacterized protein AMSG_06639 [Thecamonas trahens ATCC 50062]|uniref:PX domain-containing protein n=1 Tax=Thecamonas trahens ATCC 50062 TaxID=461836 RepID=A0A0L0DEV2_THETB|nr:hypothetical protein AMSG_06639 [Thecamonas trahens ATCC 50062]KNC50750.1 hypothetical protein AMSG_06639 [Thecamonas trahens ATCC 50062]|eukprot:XP_013756715.1 hypothetical protein AMSG_06639 [Thecamonas trahens ATCC 50062]
MAAGQLLTMLALLCWTLLDSAGLCPSLPVASRPTVGDRKGVQHTEYGIKVKTHDGQYRVYRRYRDFERLVTKIAKGRKAAGLPPVAGLPAMPKKSLLSRFKSDVVEKRKRAFNDILQFLLQAEPDEGKALLSSFLAEGVEAVGDSSLQKIRSKAIAVKVSLADKKADARRETTDRHQASLCRECKDDINYSKSHCASCASPLRAASHGQTCRACNIPATRCYKCNKAGAAPVRACVECAKFCLACEEDLFDAE